METIKLKNGSEESVLLVTTTMMLLEQIWRTGLPGINMLYYLVQICRNDQTERRSDKHEKELKRLGLLEEADDEKGAPRVKSVTRNIVLSAFSGLGMDLTLGSPVAEKMEQATA